MIIQRRKARSTGTMVSVVDNRQQQFMADDLRWYTVCEDHGGCVGHNTRAFAVGWASEPEGWCPLCQERRGRPATQRAGTE